MRSKSVALSIAALLGGALSVSCGAEDAEEGVAEFGQLELALLGDGSLGGSFELIDASFTVTGPETRTVSGDDDVVVETLEIGSYTAELEEGWTLLRTDGEVEEVSAVLASANPQPFIINGAATTSLAWQFNVTGDYLDKDDLEIVTVSSGAVEFVLDGGEQGFENFATGQDHACGITDGGDLKCWGNNYSGQLGYGDTVSLSAPPDEIVNVGLARKVKRVAASRGAGDFTCALLDDDTVKCWGDSSRGQLGYGSTADYRAPSDPVIDLGSSNTAKTISVGEYFACVILDSNAVKCWGENGYGQLGRGNTSDLSSPPADPINLGPGAGAKSLALGNSHACALLSDGNVKCWGYNNYGQLGVGGTNNSYSPSGNLNLGADRTAKRIAAGYYHTCAILDNDTVKCWGHNNYGQLGYGDASVRYTPPSTAVNLGEGRTAQRIATGNYHTCALLDDGTIKCWGRNSYGELGYEDTNQRSAPASLAVDLGTGRAASKILASGDHTCVLLTDNAVKCWGHNTSNVFGVPTDSYVGDETGEMGDLLPELLP